MPKIRADLVGVVFVYVDDAPVQLGAGDDIPEGAEVGDHLLEQQEKPARATRRKSD